MNDSPKQHGKCSFCDTEVYVKVKQYLMPVLSPLTHEQALRDELVNITGETYTVLHRRFCPVCGRKVKGVMDND